MSIFIRTKDLSFRPEVDVDKDSGIPSDSLEVN